MKSELQELCQKKGFPVPRYTAVDKATGPAHCLRFVRMVSVEWEGVLLEETGEGRTKKDAEKEAARKMHMRINPKVWISIVVPEVVWFRV